ncbi:MAG: PAS domain S-box protein [Thermodesulfobacteriota bacterium]|nr:PAS domain S-box protein [Thermodesulfobacteriota bacterium]
MKHKNQKRFSTYLITTYVILATVSVLVILAALHIYFGTRVESEFHKKLRAQRGQVEIILNNRIADIKDILKNLSFDNTIRVTLMLGAKSQLRERVTQFYPSRDGVYYFVKKSGGKTFFPDKYSKISKKTIDFAAARLPQGKILKVGDRLQLIWWFSAPVMHLKKHMGTAYVLYDLTQDKKLIEKILKTVDGEIAILNSGRLFRLNSKDTLPLDPADLNSSFAKSEFISLGSNVVLSEVKGFYSLFFLSSKESLISEKRRVTFLMGLFSLSVLAVSIIMSIFLSKQMVEPLREMTRKAILISKGNKELLFEKDDKDYWEFNQLSQAFNFMLANLKDAEEQSRYKELLENVDDAVYIFDQEGNILEANEAAYLQLGYTSDMFFNLNLSAIIPEKDTEMIIKQIDSKTVSSNQDKITLVTCHFKTDGSCIPVEINSRPITYRGKKVILNVARNISKRIEAENALRESEERYRSVVENSHDGIMVIDDNSTILYANSVLPRILGYTLKEIEGSNFRKYLADKNAILTPDHLLDQQHNEKIISYDEYDIICKNSEKKCVKIRANRFKDSKGRIKTVALILDITKQLRIEQEKKQLEAQLIHAQKMEAIGTLAGGIAHDFNNVLMSIQGNISTMRLHIKTDQPQSKYIAEIENSIASAGNLTKQLLSFSRKEKYKLKSICLNDIIETSSAMFIRARKEIKLHKKLVKDIRDVKVDKSQIEQVLINLYVNAWHAMPKGGDLYLQTENVRLNDDFCEPFKVPGGNYVNISVTDTGAGMDKKIMRRIFEPFFTTKEAGKGTGFGLALTYSIITNHRGIIKVSSKKGHGSTFNIYLPAP